MGNMRTSGFPKTQTEFFNFSSLYNSSLLRMFFSCFSAKANQPARVYRGPLERVGLRGDSFSIVLHLQHLPLQRAHPVPPCTPNSTQRKPPIGSSPEPRGPASGHLFLQPSGSVPGLRGPGVTSQELRGTPRRRTCGSGPGHCPPAPSGRGRLTSGGGGGGGCLWRRSAPPLQTAPACGQRGAASELRPPPGPHGERELGDPARLRRQVGRAGWGSRRRDRPCAPPSPARRGAGADERSPPFAQRTQASVLGLRESALQSTLGSGSEEP